jgi:hypothetical protein
MFRVLLIATGLLAVCVVINVAGMVALADAVMDRREAIRDMPNPFRFAMLMVVVFSGVLVLNIISASIWAFFYYQSGLFDSLETSFYFSLKSYSTVGYGDVLLPQKWRLLGTIEALSGALLCGLSTAFLFAFLNAWFRARLDRLDNTPR